MTLGQCRLAEPIPLQARPQPKSSNSEARPGLGHLIEGDFNLIGGLIVEAHSTAMQCQHRHEAGCTGLHGTSVSQCIEGVSQCIEGVSVWYIEGVSQCIEGVSQCIEGVSQCSVLRVCQSVLRVCHSVLRVCHSVLRVCHSVVY